jgi:AcrR family transcriptional regulator
VAILEAAARLFATRGIAGTSLNDIAAAIGLTKGAIYASFPNKQAVVNAVAAQRRLTVAFEPLYREDLPLPARLRALGKNIAAAKRQVPRRLFLLDLEYYLDAQRNPATRQHLAGLARTHERETVRRFEAANRARGEVPPLRSEEFLTAVNGVAHGVVQMLLANPHAISERGIERLFELLAGE